MEVKQADGAFRPITIVLETADEVFELEEALEVAINTDKLNDNVLATACDIRGALVDIED